MRLDTPTVKPPQYPRNLRGFARIMRKPAPGLPQRVKEYRRILGLTNEALTTLLGKGSRTATLSSWENGKHPIPHEIILLMSHLTEHPGAVYVWLMEGGQAPRFRLRRVGIVPIPSFWDGFD